MSWTPPVLDAVFTALAALTVLVWAAYALEVTIGRRLVPRLDQIAPLDSDAAGLPTISVVIAARDEADAIEEALASVVALDYPELEIVVVDDRSSDGTGKILDRMASDEPRLKVIHIEELPTGWLGKTWALQQGAERSSGEVLLFTDADVWFEPSVLRRAVTVLEERELDHLTASADVQTSGLLLELFVSTFALCFLGYFRPWRAADPKRREAVGIGAFNLVRREAWLRAGTHEAVALALDDDLRLGIVLKQSGARQSFAVSGDLISVEWYPSFGAAVRGLEKNSLAAVGGSWVILLGGGLAQLVVIAWPFVGVFLTRGWAQGLNAVTVALILTIHLVFLRGTSLRAWTAFALPLGVVLIVTTTMRAAILAKLRGGVYWRGTFYSNDYLEKRDRYKSSV